MELTNNYFFPFLFFFPPFFFFPFFFLFFYLLSFIRIVISYSVFWFYKCYSLFGIRTFLWTNTIWYSVFEIFHERILFSIRYSEIFHERILFSIWYSETLHEQIYSVFGQIHYSVQLWWDTERILAIQKFH